MPAHRRHSDEPFRAATRGAERLGRFSGAPSRYRRRGTSLIEVVIVLAVIATLAAIAQPRYAGALSRYHADSAARRIIADFAAARQRARATGVPQAFL
ncbi:MAG: pilus assembly FimT family protein, partial [Planctomycetota bacterium]